MNKYGKYSLLLAAGMVAATLALASPTGKAEAKTTVQTETYIQKVNTEGCFSTGWKINIINNVSVHKGTRVKFVVDGQVVYVDGAEDNPFTTTTVILNGKQLDWPPIVEDGEGGSSLDVEKDIVVECLPTATTAPTLTPTTPPTEVPTATPTKGPDPSSPRADILCKGDCVSATVGQTATVTIDVKYDQWCSWNQNRTALERCIPSVPNIDLVVMNAKNVQIVTEHRTEGGGNVAISAGTLYSGTINKVKLTFVPLAADWSFEVHPRPMAGKDPGDNPYNEQDENGMEDRWHSGYTLVYPCPSVPTPEPTISTRPTSQPAGRNTRNTESFTKPITGGTMPTSDVQSTTNIWLPAIGFLFILLMGAGWMVYPSLVKAIRRR